MCIEPAASDFWSAFVPQLLASLVGAGAAVYAVFIGFRLQQKGAQQDAIDVAVERLLLSLAEYVTQLVADRVRRKASPDRSIPRPQGFDVSIAVEILVMRTQRADREMALRFSSAWDEIKATPYVNAKQTASGLLAGVITGWRTGDSVAESEDSIEYLKSVARNETEPNVEGDWRD